LAFGLDRALALVDLALLGGFALGDHPEALVLLGLLFVGLLAEALLLLAQLLALALEALGLALRFALLTLVLAAGGRLCAGLFCLSAAVFALLRGGSLFFAQALLAFSGDLLRGRPELDAEEGLYLVVGDPLGLAILFGLAAAVDQGAGEIAAEGDLELVVAQDLADVTHAKGGVDDDLVGLEDALGAVTHREGGVVRLHGLDPGEFFWGLTAHGEGLGVLVLAAARGLEGVGVAADSALHPPDLFPVALEDDVSGVRAALRAVRLDFAAIGALVATEVTLEDLIHGQSPTQRPFRRRLARYGAQNKPGRPHNRGRRRPAAPFVVLAYRITPPLAKIQGNVGGATAPRPRRARGRRLRAGPGP
jgi:hypothetical protein